MEERIINLTNLLIEENIQISINDYIKEVPIILSYSPNQLNERITFIKNLNLTAENVFIIILYNTFLIEKTSWEILEIINNLKQELTEEQFQIFINTKIGLKGKDLFKYNIFNDLIKDIPPLLLPKNMANKADQIEEILQMPFFINNSHLLSIHMLNKTTKRNIEEILSLKIFNYNKETGKYNKELLTKCVLAYGRKDRIKSILEIEQLNYNEETNTYNEKLLKATLLAKGNKDDILHWFLLFQVLEIEYYLNSELLTRSYNKTAPKLLHLYHIGKLITDNGLNQDIHISSDRFFKKYGFSKRRRKR